MQISDIALKIKTFFLTTFFIIALVFIFTPADIPENEEFKEILRSVSKKEVLIVFNSGGWGNTPVNESEDFSPIIEGIQKTLEKLGYESVLAHYKRGKNTFPGKIEAIREFLTLFPHQSRTMFEEIKRFSQKNPNNKIVMAGLSNGAVFVDKVMEKTSEEGINNVFAIEVGVPFWEKSLDSKNILSLNNKNEDPLFEKKTWTLFLSLFKAPVKWGLAKVSGDSMSFSEAFYFPGHDYSWDSSVIGPEVVLFLENNFSR